VFTIDASDVYAVYEEVLAGSFLVKVQLTLLIVHLYHSWNRNYVVDHQLGVEQVRNARLKLGQVNVGLKCTQNSTVRCRCKPTREFVTGINFGQAQESEMLEETVATSLGVDEKHAVLEEVAVSHLSVDLGRRGILLDRIAHSPLKVGCFVFDNLG
jgi:hypothetical protein